MFTIYSVYIHYIFTIYSQNVHYIFTIYSLYIRYTFTIYSLYIHYIFTIYSLYILYKCHDGYLTLLSNSWKTSWNIAEDEEKYQPVFLVVFSGSRVTKSQVYIHYMFTIYSVYIHYIFTIYSLYVHYIFTIYSLYVSWQICDFIVNFLKDSWDTAKVSTGISAWFFRVTCNKVSSIYSLYVHYIFIIYSLYIHYIFTICLLFIHYIFTVGVMTNMWLYCQFLERQLRYSKSINWYFCVVFQGHV